MVRIPASNPGTSTPLRARLKNNEPKLAPHSFCIFLPDKATSPGEYSETTEWNTGSAGSAKAAKQRSAPKACDECIHSENSPQSSRRQKRPATRNGMALLPSYSDQI